MRETLPKEQSSSKLKIGTKNVLTINFHAVERKKCKLKYVQQWLNLFTGYYSKEK